MSPEPRIDPKSRPVFDATEFSNSWVRWRRRVDLDEYDRRWDRLEADGEAVHGEADFVGDLIADDGPVSVLDAGCGTGRVALELARRGFDVAGVDNDADMLAYARSRNDRIDWVRENLSTVELGRSFDAIVMAGNVLVFARPEDRRPIVATMARHLRQGGVLVNGSNEAGGYTTALYDRWCSDAGLRLDRRFGGWGCEPFETDGYAVSVHRLG